MCQFSTTSIPWFPKSSTLPHHSTPLLLQSKKIPKTANQNSKPMETLASAFPLTRPPPLSKPKPSSPKLKPIRISIRPPPLTFDYRRQLDLLEESRSTATFLSPPLADLVNDGSLVIVKKGRFGTVPIWRREFVEPEEIWLIGTSHLSEQSVKDVERVVRTVRPDNVVVELCRSRAGIMYTSNEAEDAPLLKSNMFSLSGGKFFGAINRSINLGGQSALALRLLLAVFSSKISDGANRPFGDEFRAARKSSEEIGAQIVLGDRPIEITLQRAWSSLKWNEKLKLLKTLFRGISSSPGQSESTLKDQKMDASPFELYKQLSMSYPSLLQPLIHERDVYLAWSLKRSKAVNNCKTVVGIIGKGHMNGVIYALISDQGDLRFRDVAGYPDGSNTWVGSFVKGLARDTILGVILWVLYEQLKVMF